MLWSNPTINIRVFSSVLLLSLQVFNSYLKLCYLQDFPAAYSTLFCIIEVLIIHLFKPVANIISHTVWNSCISKIVKSIHSALRFLLNRDSPRKIRRPSVDRAQFSIWSGDCMATLTNCKPSKCNTFCLPLELVVHLATDCNTDWSSFTI